MIAPYIGQFKVSQIYKGATHKGIDLVGLTSKNIYSVCHGIVEAVRWDNHPTGGFGFYIRVKEFETNRYFYYAHLSEAFAKVGEEVRVGDAIGIEGSTGHSTGSHLHLEIRNALSNTTFVNVAEELGIPNKLGTYENVDYKALYESTKAKLDEIEQILRR